MSHLSFNKVFQSASFTQPYLQNSYERSGVKKSKEMAYENSYSVIYFTKMGNQFFEEGSRASIAIQPMLLFYGLCHWLKAAVLTVDPTYPANAQVLAHGLSTRKRKKKGYHFLQDEVRIQKEGLFPYLSKTLFHVKQLSGEKLTMRHLIYSIPELNNLLVQLFPTKNIALPSSSQENDKNWTTTYRPGLFAPLPELLIHYALLYQLSMICRYETEWWGELLYSFSSNDLPIISEFLSVTTIKCPQLIEDLLLNNDDEDK